MTKTNPQAAAADSKPRTFTDAVDDLDGVLLDLKCLTAAIDRAVDEAPFEDDDATRVIGHIDGYNRILVDQLDRAVRLSAEIHALGKA